MKHLLFLLLTVFTVNLFGQDAIISEEELINRFDTVIIQQAKRFKQDPVIVAAVVVAYMEPDSVDIRGKVKTFTIETERGLTFKGTGWSVINQLCKFMQISQKTKRNCTKIKCWKHSYFGYIDIVPEHPLVDPTRVLVPDEFGGFKDVPNIEEPEPAIINIETGKPLSATCDPNNPKSLCEWMKNPIDNSVQEQARQNVISITKDNMKFRTDLKNIEYDWAKSIDQTINMLNNLRDLEKTEGKILPEEILRFYNTLLSLREKYNSVNNRYAHN